MATSLLASASNTLAQGQPNTKKVYRAKVYAFDNKKVRGILYSVDDSSISLCIDTAFMKNDPLNQSFKVIAISYQDIKKIKVIRQGALGKGFLIGALTGAVPGLMIGAAADVGDAAYGATVTVLSWGTVTPEPEPSFIPVSTLVGFTIGGLIGLAVASPSKNFLIYNNIERYNTQKRRLSMYSVSNSIYYTSEKLEPPHLD